MIPRWKGVGMLPVREVSIGFGEKPHGWVLDQAWNRDPCGQGINQDKFSSCCQGMEANTDMLCGHILTSCFQLLWCDHFLSMPLPRICVLHQRHLPDNFWEMFKHNLTQHLQTSEAGAAATRYKAQVNVERRRSRRWDAAENHKKLLCATGRQRSGVRYCTEL